ncbi:hypothetical protein [Fulvivirga sediminis]|uniref:Lipoprotein n=1 Tax=Fulvivirga sediminis TaxID=2803949 RepID=A0A937F9X7_9BACT|nr:hypothetical protein [Fulvivirga sediminis]MBL3659001.1 hypothetical protein [Fulvivirga sediminis]
MKKTLLIFFTLLMACGPKNGENQVENRNEVPIDSAIEQSSKNDNKVIQIPEKSDQEQPIDTFFYTNRLHQKIADRNRLDMFKVNSETRLDIVGKSVPELKYEIGEGVNHFLISNLRELDTMNFGWIETVEWSTDLRGDDTKKFIFDHGILKEVN